MSLSFTTTAAPIPFSGAIRRWLISVICVPFFSNDACQ